MCGIALALLPSSLPPSLSALLWAHLTLAVTSRGPDAQHQLSLDLPSLPDSDLPMTLKAFGATLWMRGALTSQPIRHHHDQDHFLLFNGEIFDGLHVSPDQNDAVVLLNNLQQCATTPEILALLQTIQGPFALAYFRVLHFDR